MSLLLAACASGLLVGHGIWDITGAPQGVGMMGYANPAQVTTGLHFRQRARAIVLVDEQTGKRVAIVSADTAMFFANQKRDILAGLSAAVGAGVYTYDNVVLSAIHNHGGPGGFSHYTLYCVTTLGYNELTADAITQGIVRAVLAAHNAAQRGTLTLAAQGTLYNASISRSLSSYLNNPAPERARYDGSVDSTVHVLRADRATTPLAVMSWFAVHCTSMNNTNTLITGDNKGRASMLLEQAVSPGSNPGASPFHALFFSANLGDVSPNTRGASCPDGTPCDGPHSTCGGKNEGCIGKGPGRDMSESTDIIARKQVDAVQRLWRSAAGTPALAVDGALDFRHVWINMSVGVVPPAYSRTGKQEVTCPAALGEAFAAGTTDGPGAFDFYQGDNSTLNPFWSLVRGVIRDPSPQQVQCQAPKPILLDVGEMPLSDDGPAALLGKHWVADVVPTQLIRLAPAPAVVLLAAIPGELSTMAGRRMRAAIADAYKAAAGGDITVTVLLTGLSNEYTHYITTPEEYVVQRYEGASTLYGPNTLDRYRYVYSALATALAKGAPVDPAVGLYPEPQLPPQPPTFILPVVFDDVPPFHSFGDVHTDASASYRRGETVMVVFWSGNPRNNLRSNTDGYLVVEKKDASGQWVVYLNDGSWHTRMSWAQVLVAYSYTTITWDIAADVPAGTYRIVHYGTAKTLASGYKDFVGTSREFVVA